MSEIWYYEFIVKIYDEFDNKEKIYSGVVPADSMTSVVEQLEEYYGELMEIQKIVPITEGKVFDFEVAMNEKDFDFIIKKKGED